MTRKRTTCVALLACAGLVSIPLVAGVAPAVAKAKKKTVTKTATFNQCSSFAVPIPDFPSTGSAPVDSSRTATIPVSVPKFKGKPQDGVVTGFTDVDVRVSHTFAGDLAIYAVSPGGQAALLAYRRGGNADGYGTGSASCAGSPVLFGDSFPNSIASLGGTSETPITGSFRPEQSLARFVGGPARGNWTLIVTDEDNQDTGVIDGFSLNFTYSYKAQVKKKGKK
jgi:subtilisin-like proprotein convertase family protein